MVISMELIFVLQLVTCFIKQYIVIGLGRPPQSTLTLGGRQAGPKLPGILHSDHYQIGRHCEALLAL